MRRGMDFSPNGIFFFFPVSLSAGNDRLIPDPTADPSPARTLSLYLIKIARLGGYLARAKDPPSGNIVMWRGISRLNDIALGATLQINNVGN